MKHVLIGLVLGAVLAQGVGSAAQPTPAAFGAAFCAKEDRCRGGGACLYGLGRSGNLSDGTPYKDLHWVVCSHGRVASDLGTPGERGPDQDEVNRAFMRATPDRHRDLLGVFGSWCP